MNHLILGIDAGNYKAKVVGPYGIDSYRTAICEWFERDIVELHGEDDMEFQIGNRKGFAGTIAVYEDEFGEGSMFGDTKAHEDTKIRVLLAIYRYLTKYNLNVKNVSLVTGQPITSHKENEKEIIKEMLNGVHRFVVNGKNVEINIRNVGIGAEGSGAFWSSPENGLVRILDIGSGTINGATIKNRLFINNASDTFNFGMETVNNKDDLEGVARGIIRATTRLKWDRNDTVFLCGGIAKEIFPYIYSHYSSAKLMKPVLKLENEVIITDAIYANAVGFYELAESAFG